MDTPLDAALVEAGLHGQTAGGGMESAAFSEALGILRKELEQSTANHAAILRRALTWAELNDNLRFTNLRIQLAEALLQPWLTAQPSAEVEKNILSLLLKHYNDPRLYRQHWIGISESSQQIVRRWLTKNSLEQFIAVVRRVAKASHWRFREAFWMSYYKKDVIDEAWILFGRAARSYARQAFEEATGFGEIQGGQPNHCVLLLRIGDLTIADWSHDGKCHVWVGDNRGAPKLYKLNNLTWELKRDADYEQSHHGSERHTWQERVANYIYDKTGAWVAKSDRIPRGR
jgi:hypothetical protein